MSGDDGRHDPADGTDPPSGNDSADGADGTDGDGGDGRTGEEGTDPVGGGEERVREAAPDDAEEAADEVAHSVLAVERTVLVASVVVTVLLLGFLAYSAATTPETAPPSVEVVGAAPTGNGTDHVRVAVTNHGGTGLEVVTVAVDCGDVATEMGFRNVPATDTATGIVVCPSGADRTVAVRSWTVA